jgi:hypothetical protein
MSDGHRVFPVNKIVVHHSVGPEFVDAEDNIVSDWFSNTGRGRGYKGIAHSFHYDPRTKKETFSQAHYALHRYTRDGNKYGWKLILLIDDPMNNVAWHASNWAVNQQSIGIEVCGDYSNEYLPPEALMLIADSFRGLDQELKGWLEYHYHRQFAATACPGKIAEQIPMLYDMANNPEKWNKQLFAPVVPPEDPIKSLQNQLDQANRIIGEKNTTITQLNGRITDITNNNTNLVDKIHADYKSQLEIKDERLQACAAKNRELLDTLTETNKKEVDELREELNSKIAELSSKQTIVLRLQETMSSMLDNVLPHIPTNLLMKEVSNRLFNRLFNKKDKSVSVQSKK